MTDKLTTQEVIDELCDLYRTLIRNLNPNNTSTDDGSSHAKPGSRPAIRLDISHDRHLIDTLAEKTAKTIREQLGFQHYTPRTIRRRQTAWHITRYVCRVEDVEIIDYATIATLRALPALIEAHPSSPRHHHRDLDKLRRRVRITLSIDKPPMRLTAACPECHGWTIPLLEPQNTLLADVQEARVWCSNPQCGYACENPSCWCAVPGQVGHQLEWTHTDLIRLSRLLETA